MNYITHLQFGENASGLYDREYLVVETKMRFCRDDDGYNPVSVPRCASLDLTVVAPPKNDLFFQEWFFECAVRSGRVVFELPDVSSEEGFTKTRYLSFSDARCYQFSERYDKNAGSLRLFDLKVRVGGCVMDDVSFHD